MDRRSVVYDDSEIVSDLLQLLDSIDGDDLAVFLESEHRELLSLRGQVHIYESALSELKLHLHHVFSAVGGLGSLPLSTTTRDALGLPKLPNGSTMTGSRTSMAPSYSPMSASTAVGGDRNSFMRVSQIIPAFPPTPTDTKTSHESSTLSYTKGVQTEDTDYEAHLKQVIVDQQSGIKRLESSLREYKTQNRSLRKKLRDKDKSDQHSTTSTVVSGSSSLPQLPKSRSSADYPPRSRPSKLQPRPEGHRKTHNIQSSCSMTSDGESMSKNSGATFTNKEETADESLAAATTIGQHKSDVCFSTKETTIGTGDSITDVSPLSSPTPSQQKHSMSGLLVSRFSLASEADTGGRRTSIGSMQQQRAPHLFRSVVATTPRRIYSRLSSRLKKV